MHPHYLFSILRCRWSDLIEDVVRASMPTTKMNSCFLDLDLDLRDHMRTCMFVVIRYKQ